MSRSKAKSASRVPSEDDIAQALERIVPRMEISTMTLVTEELAVNFDVTAEEIKEYHRDFVFARTAELATRRGNVHGACTPHTKNETSSIKRSKAPTSKEAPPGFMTSTTVRKKLTTGKRQESPDTDTNMPNLPVRHTRSGSKHGGCIVPKKRPSPSDEPNSTTLPPIVTPRPSPAPRKKPRAMNPPPHGVDSSSQRKESKPQAITDSSAVQAKRFKQSADTGKTNAKISNTTNPTTPQARKQPAPDANKSKTPTRDRGSTIVQASAAAPSARCLKNLTAMAKAAGMLSPRSKLARNLRGVTKDAEKVEMDSERAKVLRDALAAAGISFRGLYPTKTEISECEATRERMEEREDMDVRNIIPASTTSRGRSASHKLHRADPPAVKRADPYHHFVFSDDDEEKQDDSDASAPSIGSGSD